MYRRLALNEEREVAASYGPAWSAYAAITPRFLPHRRPVAAVAQPRVRGSRS